MKRIRFGHLRFDVLDIVSDWSETDATPDIRISNLWFRRLLAWP